MRHHLRRHFRPALTCLLTALIVLTTLLPAALRPSVAEAKVQPGGAFGSAVACLNNPDQFVTTRFANTIYTTAGYAPSSTPAVQIVTSGATQTLAISGNVGAVYGLAYDDGAVSGRERIFAAAYTKRLSGYSSDGNASIFMMQRSGNGWGAPVRFAATNVPAHPAPNTLRSLTDTETIDDVSKRTMGDMEVSPDGRGLYVVNIQNKQIEVFDLTVAGVPSYARSIPINLGVISTAPNVQADLWPFALEFFPYRVGPASNELILNVGVTDSAQRGFVAGKPQMSGANFVTPPRAYVLGYNVTKGGANDWAVSLNQDLGNAAALDQRHAGSTWDAGQDTAAGLFGYADKPWYPWQDQLDTLPRNVRTVFYPQPLLTDIEFVSEAVPTSTPAFSSAPTPPWPMMVLGIRDRTGDQVFNGNAAVPTTDYLATAQGDTLVYRLSSGAWALQSGEFYDDNTHLYPGPVPAHRENHMGALASVPSAGLTLDAFAETLATTTLAGSGRQAVRVFENTARTGGGGTDTLLINGGELAATKATNLGDMELLCSYALVGGRVWNDANTNGVREGSESGLANIALDVILNPATPRTAPAVASATTDGQGRYLFAVPANTTFGIRIAATSRASLESGNYPVPTSPPFRITPQNRGGNDNSDSDISAPWGIIEFAQSGSGFTGFAIAAPWRESDERRYDIGLTQARPTGQIGDRVWTDSNGNGVQNGGEPGLSGQPVTLDVGDTAAPIPAYVVRSVTTDGGGNYFFRDLPAGQYRVQFALPAGRAATLRDQGGNDALDSDADASTGYATGWFTLAESQPDTSRDFGVIGGVDVFTTIEGPTGVPSLLTNGNRATYTIRYGNLSSVAALGAGLTYTPPANVQIVSYGTPLTTAPAAPTATPAPTSTPGPNPTQVGGGGGGIKPPKPPPGPVLNGGGSVQINGTWQGNAEGQAIRWSLGTLAPGATGFVNVVLDLPLIAPSLRETITNRSDIATTSRDINLANNRATIDTAFGRPELRIVKTASASPVLVGDPYTYQLALTNVGTVNARDVAFTDVLPTGLTFIAFTANPGNACSFTAATSTVQCFSTSVVPESYAPHPVVAFSVRATTALATAQVTNRVRIMDRPSTDPTPGDIPGIPGGNEDDETTPILFPDPSVTITINPAQSPVGATTPQFPVGSDGLVRIGYGNGGTGLARSSVITATLDARLTLGTLPSGCTLLGAPSLRVRCTVGDLATGAAGTGSIALPVTLPASFPADAVSVSAIIATTTPERLAAQGNNSASAIALVMRPNVFTTVTAVNKSAPERGAAGWRSFVRYQLGYGNDVANPDPRRTAAERARPADLTWPASSVILTATLPLNTSLDRVTDAAGAAITGFTTATDGSGRTTLTFALNTRAPRATGGLFITVLAGADPGVQLELSSVISTATPGDDLADNTARDATGVAAPPTSIEPADGTIRLAIRSELDPNSQDGAPANGVYLSDGPAITWPAGEVLDFTPRLTELDIPDTVTSSDPLYPYGYYARVAGWSVVSFTVNGTSYDAETHADSAGKRGCRAGNRLSDGGTTLPGCGYVYPGATAGTVPPSEALPPFVLTEAELARQAHAYWTNPPLPSMRDDVYTYAVAPLAPVQITVAVEVEVEVVNLAPCAPLGDWTCAPVRDPAFPVERQILTQTFTINLLVPRSIVGPGGARPETGTTKGR